MTCHHRERPYQHDSTASRLLSEVKHARARLVLRWGTTLESRVLFSFCRQSFFLHNFFTAPFQVIITMDYVLFIYFYRVFCFVLFFSLVLELDVVYCYCYSSKIVIVIIQNNNNSRTGELWLVVV